MNKHEENPSLESNSESDNEQDAAALFTQLASQDSNDSEQASDEDTLDGSEEEESDTGTEENEQASIEQGQADDPWAQVDEPLRNEFLTLQANHSKLQNDHKANAGRVQALNQKVADFQKQVEKSEQQQGEPSSKGPTADDLEGMSFEEVEQEWPEVAGYLKKQLEQGQAQLSKQFDAKLSQLSEKLNPFEEMRQQQEQSNREQHVITELERLKQVHPDYQEVASDSKFNDWVKSQPDTVKAMAKSTFAADNIILLNLYKGSSSNPARSTRSNLSDHAVIPKKGSGQKIQTDPNNIDPVQLFTHLASKKK